MNQIEKTVFLSYRRASATPWAVAIYQNLTQQGFDVFFDFLGIASGDFESVILENIVARAHFVVLLTPSALDRCDDANDWLRREIETALKNRRNIVPLMFEGFDFKTAKIAKQLTGDLAALSHYNALCIPPEFFLEAMERLRQRYLNIPLSIVLHPTSPATAATVAQQKAAVARAPAVSEEELTASQWFELGVAAEDIAEQLRCYSEAIRLKPDFGDAYNNRAIARGDVGDAEGAIMDYTEAIRYKPAFAEAYNNRAVAKKALGDLNGAVKDYTTALRLNPGFTLAYLNRASYHRDCGDTEAAIADYSEAIRLKPDDSTVYFYRGMARSDKNDGNGAIADYTEAIRLNSENSLVFYYRARAFYCRGDIEGAIADCTEAIRLQPDFAHAYNGRGVARSDKGDVERAVADYDEAIRLKPDFLAARHNRDIALGWPDDGGKGIKWRDALKQF